MRIRVEVHSKDEVGELATVFNKMAGQVQERQAVLAEQDWLKTSLTKFAALFQGQRDPAIVCQTILNELASLLDARHSVLYAPSDAAEGSDFEVGGELCVRQSKIRTQAGRWFGGPMFSGKKRILLQEVPDDYIKIRSALGGAKPTSIIVQPRYLKVA
ncbi:MAG: HAMP domain-containing protein [Limisphaerales bacterium]